MGVHMYVYITYIYPNMPIIICESSRSCLMLLMFRIKTLREKGFAKFGLSTTVLPHFEGSPMVLPLALPRYPFTVIDLDLPEGNVSKRGLYLLQIYSEVVGEYILLSFGTNCTFLKKPRRNY